MSVRLGELTWPDVSAEVGATLVVALGSCEQHGPHLPFDTDTAIAESLLARAARNVAGVVVGPTIAYGASGEHQGFAGTLSLGTEALAALLVELARSALPPFERLVVVNGHGGNADALQQASAVARREGRRFVVWSPDVAGGDAHAGRTETSLMLALHPERVRVDRIERGNTVPMTALMAHLRADGVRAHSPNGVLGDPTSASAEHGHALVEILVGELRGLLSNASARRA